MTGITLILTYACNQDCSYCYQVRDNLKMEFATAQKAIDYFSKYMNAKSVINFYGGEPLLEFDLMKRVIQYCNKRNNKNDKQLTFSLTTNATLLDKQRLEFFNDNEVDIYLSIDGNKRAHELGRGKGSFASIEKVLARYNDFPEIPINIQMVITPNNVRHLLHSVQYLVSLGTSQLDLNLCCDQKWNQNDIETLRDQYSNAYNYLVKHKKEGGKIRFKEIKKTDPLKPLFKCDAGRDRFAITPDGFIYGCSMQVPWSKRALASDGNQTLSQLCLGHVDQLEENTLNNQLEKIYMDKRLWGQLFYYTSDTKCSSCNYITRCNICPVYAMIFTDEVFLVPDWICEIKRIEYQAGYNY
jgi:uncharacterized protein